MVCITCLCLCLRPWVVLWLVLIVAGYAREETCISDLFHELDIRWLLEIAKKDRRVFSYLRLLALFPEMCGELALR